MTPPETPKPAPLPALPVEAWHEAFAKVPKLAPHAFDFATGDPWTAFAGLLRDLGREDRRRTALN